MSPPQTSLPPTDVPATHVGPGSAPILQVTRAAKRFGTRTALDGVSLSIEPGELYALIGPNGAGKTTLVRSICRRHALDEGTVLVAGQDPTHSIEARRAIGLVPQSIALYLELSVEENLRIFGRLAGVERQRLGSAVEEALGWTGLASRATDRVSHLSGGMQRRLNIAVATLHRPRLLILDEPTVGIDPSARADIHELLGELKQQGLAILLTTHDLEQAEELADRVGVLVGGRLRAEGSLAELIGETFGNAQEIQVTFSEAPDEADGEALAAEGLQSTLDPTIWSGSLRGGLAGLADIGARLAATGMIVDEFRVREPGLRGVFLQVTGRELTP
jgi:ABC-2 type transport system ATP-binding protein